MPNAKIHCDSSSHGSHSWIKEEAGHLKKAENVILVFCTEVRAEFVACSKNRLVWFQLINIVCLFLSPSVYPREGNHLKMAWVTHALYINMFSLLYFYWIIFCLWNISHMATATSSLQLQPFYQSLWCRGGHLKQKRLRSLRVNLQYTIHHGS